MLNVCINDMMKIDMSNIYFLMLNDLRVLFNANYVQVWSSVHCHCYMLFALVFCLLSLYVKISFAVYSKVVWWNKKYAVVTDYSYTSLLRKNKNISDELSIMVRKCKKFSVQLYTYINSYFEKFKPKMIFGSKNIFPCSWIC